MSQPFDGHILVLLGKKKLLMFSIHEGQMGMDGGKVSDFNFAVRL